MTLVKWPALRPNNTMKKFSLYLLIALMLCSSLAFGQNAHFVNAGTVEFEKTINMYALFRKYIAKYPEDEGFSKPAYEQYVKNQPQFKKLKSTLVFGDNKTLFTPVEDNSPYNGFWGDDSMVGQNNTTYMDLANGLMTSQKQVFEQTFLLKDSIRKIKWKITDETREIAGYTCRRANAMVLDSVYIVAFYTDQIAAPGGPEGFTGLPGMILGVAMPHENVTWFATKVTETYADGKTLVPPRKGKPVDYKALLETLHKAMADWGKWADEKFKAFSL